MEVDNEVKLENSRKNLEVVPPLSSFYRNPVEWSQDYIEFQATEWYETNAETERSNENFEDKEYLLKIFGVTEKGYSVCCNVNEYTPFFYIKVPDNWDKNKVRVFLTNLFETQGNYNGKSYYPLKYLRRYLVQDKCIIQKKKDFYGFTGEKLFKFLRLTFRNSDAMKKCVNLMKSHNNKKNPTRVKDINFDFKLYESNVDNFLRIIHIRNLKPTGWILAEGCVVTEKKSSSCQIEIDVKWTDLHDLDKVNNAPLLQASFDIETYSHDGNFPSPTREKDVVFQIATAFKYVGANDFYFKHLIALKACASIVAEPGEPPIILEVYETEREVLLAWSKLIKSTDPDILFSYNGDQFDCNYLVERAKFCGVEDEFHLLSRLEDVPSELNEDTFSSSAYGDNKYLRLAIPGRINFDILVYLKRELKEISYKLDSISEKYLGENKNPVTAQMMFDYFEKGDPELLRDVALYCLQDTALPQKLCDKLFILQNQISMSCVTYVPIKWLLEKGQSIKVFSQVLRETRKKNFLIPVLDYDQYTAEKIVGATVLEPEKGAYFTPITVCDFASLYPSIIRAHNLCYSTIVLDPKYANLEGIDYEDFTWEETDENGDLKTVSHRYAQSIPGILPDILAELALSRKRYKKLMASAETKDLQEIYNRCQLAVKVSMNSIYGFLAAKKLMCKPIAATTTAMGRQMIKNTKNFMEKTYKHLECRAVYGDTDSVFLQFLTQSVKIYNSERSRIYKSGNEISHEDRELLAKLKAKCIQESMDVGQEAAKAATKALFKPPIDLAFEKVLMPLLMLSKKRYISELYEDNPNKMKKLDNKGVVLTRRDNFNLLKNSYRDIINIFMKDGEYGVPQVKDYLNWTFKEILDGSIDINDLVITKSLKTGYKNESIPHVVLAKKIAERDPGSAYRSNDRIPYVFVDSGETKKVPMYMKVESPDYVIKNNLNLDVEYYINFLQNPICEILELFIDNPQKIFQDEIDKYKRKRSMQLAKESKVNFMKKFKK